MQFLKILLNELIIHEIEMVISEKNSYQLINKSCSTNNDRENSVLNLFLESLGEDFLTRICQDNEQQQLTSSKDVKQEVFESGQQVLVKSSQYKKLAPNALWFTY